MVEQVKSQIGLSEHMSEVLASGIEATQAIYNNQLTIANNQLTISNNKLTMRNNNLSKVVAYLTILGTAILIPNTIATVLGNSVWVLGPDFLGAYLTLMISATVVGSVLMWVWIKKMGLVTQDKEQRQKKRSINKKYGPTVLGKKGGHFRATKPQTMTT